MTAGEMLTAVQAAGLPVTGLTIRDPLNVATWTFYGTVTPTQAAAAVQIIQRGQSVPAVSTYWARPQTQLERDVLAIQRYLGLTTKDSQ